METAKERQKYIFCFIDYSKTFDCVDHDLLWQSLLTVGAPVHIIQLLQELYNDKKQLLELKLANRNRHTFEMGFDKDAFCQPHFSTSSVRRLLETLFITVKKESELEADELTT